MAKAPAGGSGSATGPLDLAEIMPFALGSLQIAPATLEVVGPARAERIAPKVMQVLVVLADARGATVSRSALIEHCWGDRFVADDAVNRVIAHVRRLGERSDQAFFVETIPRVGFRLIAQEPAQAQQATSDHASGRVLPEGRSATASSRSFRRVAISVGLAMSVAVMSLAIILRSGGPALEPSPSRSVVLPLDSVDVSARVRDDRPIGQATIVGEREVASLLSDGALNQALDVLEALARELESSGNRAAASQAYSRFAALALLSDQGRGLAAWRRAFDLDPSSESATQGLLFDTMLLKGPGETVRLADEILTNPVAGDLARGYALAIRAVAHIEGRADAASSQQAISDLVDFGEISNDASVAALASWPVALLAWRSDRLEEAMAAVNATSPDHRFLVDVVRLRILFSSGDWPTAQVEAATLLESRRARGLFLPWPMFETACLSGLFSESETIAIGFCDAIASQQNQSPAVPRIFAAFAAAARNDHALASRELDAAAALIDLADVDNLARYQVAKVYAAGRRGDGRDMREAATAHQELVASNDWLAGQAASRNATIARLQGVFLRSPEDMVALCTELQTAQKLYDSVGVRAGSNAVSEELSRTPCRASSR